MKVSELTGAALDWAVAKAEGYEVTEDCFLKGVVVHPSITRFYPSRAWEQGGPIIEREGIHLIAYEFGGAWAAEFAQWAEDFYMEGETPLIAAMRCFVASKLGYTVDVPEGLCPDVSQPATPTN